MLRELSASDGNETHMVAGGLAAPLMSGSKHRFILIDGAYIRGYDFTQISREFEVNPAQWTHDVYTSHRQIYMRPERTSGCACLVS